MSGKKLVATMALSAVLFTGCGLKTSEAIIKVNDKNITQAQFDKAFEKEANSGMLAKLGINLKEEKNGFMYNLIKERVINELVVKSLIDQEVAKRDIKVTKDDLNLAIKDIVDKVGSKEQLDQILKERGISPADFKNDLSEQVKIKKLTSELGSSDVSDADAKKFYDKNVDKFKYPDKIRASHILIAVEPQNTTSKAQEAKAESLLAQVQKDPTQFAKLAKENSQDPGSAAKGGDLGFFSKDEMVPEFSKAAFGAKPNTIVSKVILTPYGYHIIMVTDRMAAGQQPYEKVKNDIKAYLADQKQVELLDKLVESLKKNSKIEFVNAEYNPENIRRDIQKQMKDQSEQAKQETTKKK